MLHSNVKLPTSRSVVGRTLEGMNFTLLKTHH